MFVYWQGTFLTYIGNGLVPGIISRLCQKWQSRCDHMGRYARGLLDTLPLSNGK